MKKFFIALVFIGSLLSFTGCSSGSDVGTIVCDYGTVLCDVSTTLCREVPGVPNEVCNYLDLACYNLNTLCSYRDSTDAVQYEQALGNLQDITKKLREWQSTQNK